MAADLFSPVSRIDYHGLEILLNPPADSEEVDIPADELSCAVGERSFSQDECTAEDEERVNMNVLMRENSIRKKPFYDEKEVRRILFDHMCDTARRADDKHELATNAYMRYSDPNRWYAFEPGIFEMKKFAEIINGNISGIMEDTLSTRTPHYFRTLAVSLMNQFYIENPRVNGN